MTEKHPLYLFKYRGISPEANLYWAVSLIRRHIVYSAVSLETINQLAADGGYQLVTNHCYDPKEIMAMVKKNEIVFT